MTTTPTTTAPYCNQCGYELTGLTESSKCPECGRPLVEVLTRAPKHLEWGKRYRLSARIFGLPVIDIALGPKNGELRGRATGFIAIGDVATGVLAMGGVARGGVAIGGLALGGITLGGASVGAIAALGGSALSLLGAVGGCAVGALAVGGAAIGIVAQGGAAFGLYARGGNVGPSPSTQQLFGQLDWFFGSGPLTMASFLQPALVIGSIVLASALLIVAIGLPKLNARDD
jgi:hypothetical protein